MDLLADLVEDPQIAPKRLRVAAALIDSFILFLAGFLLSLLSGQSGSYSSSDGASYSYGFHLTGLPALLFFLIGIILLPGLEGLTGKTIGQRLLKIRVVKDDFSDTSFGNSLARHLFDPIDCFFLIGLIIASTNKKKQRIGDLVAKTIVVRDQ